MLMRVGLFRLSVVSMVIVMVLLSAGCGKQREHISKNRADAISLYVDAMMLNDLDERDKAIQKLDLAVELDPEFALAYSLMGDIYQDAEKYDKSAESYESATILDPWSFRDFFNLGKVNQIMEKFIKALKAYITACELEPEHFDAHLNAAKCFYEIENYDRSFEYSKKAKLIALARFLDMCSCCLPQPADSITITVTMNTTDNLKRPTRMSINQTLSIL